MPYFRRLTYFAALGKAPEVRKILEERTRQLRAKDMHAGLQEAVFSADGANFYAIQTFQDMAELQSWRDGPLVTNSPSTMAIMGNMPLLLHEPFRSALYEGLLTLGRPPSSPTRYFQRVTRDSTSRQGQTAPGENAGAGHKRQAEGILHSVQAQVAGPKAGELVVQLQFASLSELEEVRARVAADAASQKLLQETQLLCAGNATLEISEVLIPMNLR